MGILPPRFFPNPNFSECQGLAIRGCQGNRLAAFHALAYLFAWIRVVTETRAVEQKRGGHAFLSSVTEINEGKSRTQGNRLPIPRDKGV